MTETGTPTSAAPGEIVITRVFDAPRELVWKAWTDPEHVMRWWGPKDYTSPMAKIDLRVGGKYLYCMRSPDGQDSWNGGVYREIVPLERIVATVTFTDEHGTPVPPSQYGIPPDWPDELVAVTTFAEHGGKTTLTLRYAGIPAGDMLGMMVEGWNQSLDKFAASLR